MRNSIGRPPRRYHEVRLHAARLMESRESRFWGLRELARELGERHPSTVSRALEHPSRERTGDELPPPEVMARLSPDVNHILRGRRVLLPLPPGHVLHRVGHTPGYGYYASRHEVELLERIAREVKASPAYAAGQVLVEDFNSPWARREVSLCRGCGAERDLVWPWDEDWPPGRRDEGYPLVRTSTAGGRPDGGKPWPYSLFCETCNPASGAGAGQSRG